MGRFKFKEDKDGIVSVKEGDNVIAKYTVDYHWREVNISETNTQIKVRLYNKMKGYLDTTVELNKEEIQKIP